MTNWQPVRKPTRALTADELDMTGSAFGSMNCPQHAIGADCPHPPELPRVDDTGRIGIVRAGLEYGAATAATHCANALNEPPRRQHRITKHPQLTAPNSATAKGE
jgi:hypothetical protein